MEPQTSIRSVPPQPGSDPTDVTAPARVEDQPATPAPAARSAGRSPQSREHPVRYWLRPLLLAAMALVLLALTWWEQRRTPDVPARPDVLTATAVPADSGANGTRGANDVAADPALTDTLLRLRTALLRRDARALAKLAHPEGVLVATYSGGLPETGAPVVDAQRFGQDVLSGAQVAVLGWRSEGRGAVIVLADGWRRKPLRLSADSPLELTALAAVGLARRGGTWYWRWFLPDGGGVLAQQARSVVWQPWPA